MKFNINFGYLQAMYKMTRESQKGGLSAEEKTKEIFMKMDKNQDGNLSMQEFIKGVQTDVSILRLLTSASNTGWMGIISLYTLSKLLHIMLYLWECTMVKVKYVCFWWFHLKTLLYSVNTVNFYRGALKYQMPVTWLYRFQDELKLETGFKII